MNRKWPDGVIAALVLALAVGASAWGQDNTPPKPNAGPAVIRPSQAADEPEKDTAELAVVAIDRAAKADKYVFVFVYRTQDDATKAARKTFDAAVEKLAARAMFTLVDVTDPLEREVVAKYRLERSPTPLVLALAPNGAVTWSFTGQLAQARFETAFVSPCMEKSLKALQDRKLVFVCVQNDKTEHNAEVMQGVNEFVADAQYAKTTEVITLDPADAAEANFLMRLKVDPKTDEAVTVFLAPPGSLVGTYKGEITKDVLVAAAQSAAKGCAPGAKCGPGSSCGPKKPANPLAQPQQPGSAAKKP